MSHRFSPATVVALLGLLFCPVDGASATHVGSCGSPLQGQCYHDKGAIIAGLSGLSMDACCAECAANTTCAAWTHWVTPDGGPHCNLFGAVGNAEPCPGGASGLGPAAPPPPPPPPPPAPPCKDCPNILLMFTDDQDLIIGGWGGPHGEEYGWKNPMSQTQARIAERGVTLSQWRIHTPICGPSRSELQSGRYFHSIQSPNTTTPAMKMLGSGAVGHVDLGNKVWPHIYAKTLREEKGYTTGLFGKCMNGDCGVNTYSSGVNLHTLGAFDRWFEHAGFVNGTFFDSEKPGCVLSDTSSCGTKTFPGGDWAGRGDGYDTSTIANVTIEWLAKVAKEEPARPWAVYFAPHAPHSPATPAPWYASGTECDKAIAPRLPNWNYSGPVKFGNCTRTPPGSSAPYVDGPSYWYHGTDFNELTSCQPGFNEKDVNQMDQLAAKRCKALLSVDDAYVGIVDAVEASGQLNNTYVLLSSDHGYNLGHHMLPSNKFLLYDHSLRIPMVIMGPGIQPNSVNEFLGTQVDLAPTMLGMAGIPTPSYIDGKSIVPVIVEPTLLVSNAASIPGSVLKHLHEAGAPPQRVASFHEYYNQGPWEVGSRHPLDDWSNTYIGIHYNGPKGQYKYGVYDAFGKQSGFAHPQMYELFDLAKDPYELQNIYNSTKSDGSTGIALLTELHGILRQYYECSGAECP